MAKVNLYNLKKEEKRDSYLIGFIGYNRTGKTTIMRDVIKEYKKSYPHNEIIAYDPQNRFIDVANDKIIDEKDIYNILEKRDCLIILDDYDSLIQGNQVKGSFKQLLQLRVEYGFDIFFATHHINFIKQGMSPFISHLYLFFTNVTEKIIGIDRKVPNGKLIEFLAHESYKEGQLKGKGTFEDKNFKYIVYDNQQGKFKRFNFESTIEERCSINN